MSNTKKNLGHVTAYAYYKAGGGTMTEAEFTEYMSDFGDAAERAVDAASEAAQSKADAQTAAATATDKADEATASASSASGSAASAAEDASMASTAANTATGAATTATNAKNDAVTAKNAAQTAQAAAESAATTATQKASAAATSADTATTKATEAATTAQGISEHLDQIDENTDAIDALKEDLTNAIDAVNEFAYKNADSIENILNGENVDYSVPCVFRLGEVRSQSIYDPPSTDNTRMASQVIKIVKSTVNVSLPSGYEAIVAIYNSDGTYAGYKPNAGYTVGNFSVTIPSTPPTYSYIILAVRKTDHSAISLNAVDSSLFIVSFGTIANPINNALSISNLALYDSFGIDESTFDQSLLDIDNSGYLYRKNTLPTTHNNVAWCQRKTDISNVSVKVKFSSTVNTGIRMFFEMSNGDIMWMNFAVTTAKATSVMFYTWSVTQIAGSGLSVTPTLDTEHLLNINFVGDYIFVYLDKVLVYSYNFIASSIDVRHVCRIGYGFRGSGENAFFKPIKTKTIDKFASISFDDQLDVLQVLTQNAESYTSLFECTGFDYLLEMHNKYGCTFTLNLFRQVNATNPTFQVEDTTTKFKDEFTANSSWLKFGYHGPDGTTYPESMSVADLITNVQTVYNAITAFAGSKCIDKVARMSMFNCTHEQALALREAGLMVGFMTADDTRASNTGLSGLYLTAVQNVDYCVDYEHDIRYFRTTRRFDNYTVEEILDDLNANWNDPCNSQMFVLFSHGFTNSAMQTKLTEVIKWIDEHNLNYKFPMNIVV